MSLSPEMLQKLLAAGVAAAHTAPQKPSEAPATLSKTCDTREGKSSLPRVPRGLSLYVAAIYDGHDLPEVVYG